MCKYLLMHIPQLWLIFPILLYNSPAFSLNYFYSFSKILLTLTFHMKLIAN